MKQFSRFFVVLLCTALLAAALVGCGKTEQTDTASDSMSNDALTIQDDDTMHLNMLFSLMSTPDNGVTELLGDGNDQEYRADGTIAKREFDGVAYGHKVVFAVSYNEYNDVDSIYVEFEKSLTEQQISDTITDLVGREPKDGVWTTDTATVTLSQDDGHVCLTLKQFEVEDVGPAEQY